VRRYAVRGIAGAQHTGILMLSPAHRAFIRQQSLVAVVANGVISALFVWLFFGGLARVDLWGERGLAFDLVPTVFMITLMTTIGLTFFTRSRVRSGALAQVETTPVRLPRFPPLRGLLLALGFTLVIVPVAVALLALVWGAPWSLPAVYAFKILFGAALGFIVTPVILRLALADRP